MTYRPFAPLLATALFLLAGAALAERPPAPLTDTSSLPALGDAWRDANPYRDDETIAAVGRTLYNETCSKCHGPDMNAKGHPAPPLRRLQRYTVYPKTHYATTRERVLSAGGRLP